MAHYHRRAMGDTGEPPQLADFGQRVWARILDAAIMLPVMLIGGLLAMGPHGPTTSGEWLVTLSIVWFGVSQFEAWHDQSVGKLLAKIYISGADGRRAALRQLFSRWAIKAVPAALLLAAGATGIPDLAWFAVGAYLLVSFGCLYATSSTDPRSWHDRVTGTAVFRVPRGAGRVRPQRRGFEPILLNRKES